MPVPYRKFMASDLIVRSVKGDCADNAFDTAAKWTTDHLECGYLGWRQAGATQWLRWDTLVRVKDFSLPSGLDHICHLQCRGRLYSPSYRNDVNSVLFFPQIIYSEASPNTWNETDVSGRYRSGIDQWSIYPPSAAGSSTFQGTEWVSLDNLPDNQRIFYFGAWKVDWPAGIYMHNNQDHFMRIGFVLRLGDFVPSQVYWNVGDGVELGLEMHEVRVKYFNMVVNSLSRYTMSAVGGVEVKLHGLGFNMNTAEIDEGSGAHPFGWTMRCDKIYFVNIGMGMSYELSRDVLEHDQDFSIDSDNQVTIRSMPAMAAGTYEVRVRRVNSANTLGVDIYSYAGDWRCDPSDGLVREGSRIYFRVTEPTVKPPPKRRPLIKTKWHWRNAEGEVVEYIAPIDIREDGCFWNGRLLEFSSFTRSIGDKAGLFDLSDATCELANQDKHYSIMLNDYWLKNCMVEVFLGWDDLPSIFDQLLTRFMVDDYDHPGPTFSVRLKAYPYRYMRVKTPRYICTAALFANIHPDHVGRYAPEVLGRCSVTTGDALGAIEAVYIDTTTFTYLAAAGYLHDVLKVYSEGTFIDLAEYSIVHDDAGWTYISFINDQGKNKITFNCEGYEYEDWNSPASTGGFVANPAYVFLFFLAFIVGSPLEEIDLESFIELADEFEADGEGESGHLAIQSATQAVEIGAELCFTFGIKLFPKFDGRLAVGKKDADDLEPGTILFRQIHALTEAERPQNLNAAINRVNAKYGYFPAPNNFIGSMSKTNDPNIETYGTEMEPSEAWEFKWTTSAAIVAARLDEELLRLGYGEQLLKMTLALSWAELIDLFYTIRFQDPFAISADGEGEVGRYFYIKSLTIDGLAEKIDIVCEDIEWLAES